MTMAISLILMDVMQPAKLKMDGTVLEILVLRFVETFIELVQKYVTMGTQLTMLDVQAIV